MLENQATGWRDGETHSERVCLHALTTAVVPDSVSICHNSCARESHCTSLSQNASLAANATPATHAADPIDGNLTEFNSESYGDWQRLTHTMLPARSHATLPFPAFGLRVFNAWTAGGEMEKGSQPTDEIICHVQCCQG